MAEAEEAIRIGAINTDWTNRHVSVNNTDKLADDLAQRLRDKAPTVLTLSEVSAVSLCDRVTDRVENYKGVCGLFTSRDKIVQLWDTRTYEYDYERGPPVVSKYGKYMGVPLRHMDLGQDHLHVSVHLPYKQGKARAYELLQEYLKEIKEANYQKRAKEGYDCVYIHGDFNASCDELMKRFTDLDLNGSARLPLTFAFDGSAVTTREGGKRDNVALLGDEDMFENQYIQGNTTFSHHPIYVTSKLED